MPIPLYKQDEQIMMSTVNCKAIRNAQGKLSILVPWAAQNRDRGMGVRKNWLSQWYEWVDSPLHSQYKKEIEEKFKKAGADNVVFIRCDPCGGGGAHCLTHDIPGSVIARLQSYHQSM
jgi:hypothetical protein